MEVASTTAPVLLANFPGVDPTVPVGLAARLRAAGIGAEVFPEPIQVGKQMGYGSTRGHKLAVIVGPDEIGRRVRGDRVEVVRCRERAPVDHGRRERTAAEAAPCRPHDEEAPVDERGGRSLGVAVETVTRGAGQTGGGAGALAVSKATASTGAPGSMVTTVPEPASRPAKPVSARIRPFGG